jgi:hypothetical protein
MTKIRVFPQAIQPVGLRMPNRKPTGWTGCGKSNLFCHSEQSEESLLGLNEGKEGFLGAQRASE